MLFECFLVLFGLLLGYWLGLKKVQANKRKGIIQKDFVWSGELGMDGDSIWSSRKKLVDEHGLTFQVVPSSNRFVRTSDPEICKEVLKSRGVWTKKPSGPTSELFLSAGLTSVNGARWEHQHNAILKIFSTAEIRAAVPQLCKIVKGHVHSLRTEIHTSKPMNVNAICNNISLELIVSSTLGDFEGFPEFCSDFFEVWKWFRSSPKERSKVNKNDQIIPLKQKVQLLIDQYTQTLQNKGEVPNSFLKSLLLQEDGLNHTELLGFETVTHTATMCLWMLAENQSFQDTVSDQIRSLKCVDGPAIHSLDQLDALVKETLRLWHPVPGMQRHCLQPTTLTGQDGVTRSFKEQDSVIVDSIPMHRNPKIWDDPNDFKPHRWKSISRSQQSYYIPFGGGSRICIGQHYALMEIKVMLIYILSSFQVGRGCTPSMYLAPTLSLKDGLTLTLIPIQTETYLEEFRSSNNQID